MGVVQIVVELRVLRRRVRPHASRPWENVSSLHSPAGRYKELGHADTLDLPGLRGRARGDGNDRGRCTMPLQPPDAVIHDLWSRAGGEDLLHLRGGRGRQAAHEGPGGAIFLL